MSRGLLFVISFLTFPAAHAQSVTTSWPAYAYQYQTEPPAHGAEPGRVTVSMVSVPASEEEGFLRTLGDRVSARASDPVIVAYAKGSATASQVKPTKTVRSFEVEDPQLFDRRFTPEGIERAGTWVSIAGTGIASTMFYTSFTLGPATAGALVVAFLVTMNVKTKLMDQWLDFGKSTGARLAERAGLSQGWGVRAAEELGTGYTGFIYHFITNCMLGLALNAGDVAKTFGSVEALADLTTTSFFNVFSGSTWDAVVARMRDGTVERDKVADVVKYGNRIFLISLSAVIFTPATHVLGLSIASVYGVAGFYALAKPDGFYNIAEKIVTGMERNVVISHVLAHLGAFDQRVRALKFPLPSRRARAPRCELYFAQ